MSYVEGRRSATPRSTQAEGGTPASWVPEWVSELGLALSIPLGILALVSVVLGEEFGAGDGWLVFGAVAVAAVALGWRYHLHRQDKQREEMDLAWYRMSEFQAIDVMSGTQFEEFCEWLLGALSYRNVRRIGSTTDEDGIDILADLPGGNPVAVQCKRQKRSVEPDVVRAVHGAVTAGRHADRMGVLMTNAKVMPKGKEFADQSGVTVIDRVALAALLEEARRRIDKQAAAPDIPNASGFKAERLSAGSVSGCAV